MVNTWHKLGLSTSYKRVVELENNLETKYSVIIYLLLQEALLQHANRAMYQASSWTTSTQTMQTVPKPEGFGWRKTARSWEPLWTLRPEAAKACRELLKCGCKAQPLCTKKCRCYNAGLPCTALCHCGGSCESTQ